MKAAKDRREAMIQIARTTPWKEIATYKGIEGEDWEELCDCYKEMSRALEAK